MAPRPPRRLSALFCLAALWSSASLAEEKAAVPGPLKTVVIGLEGRHGFDPSLASVLSDVVQGVYASEEGRTVLGRQEIAQVLGFESEKQAVGCDDNSCLGELADAMDADRLVLGTLDRVGSLTLVVVSELDAKKLAPLGRVERQLTVTDEQLVNEVRSAATALVEQTRPQAETISRVGSTLSVTTKPPGARAVLSDAPLGPTPISRPGLPPGTHRLVLERDDGAPVSFEVPLYPSEATKVDVWFADGPTHEGKEGEGPGGLHWILASSKAVGGGVLTACGGCLLSGALMGLTVELSEGGGITPEGGQIITGLLIGAPCFCVPGLGLATWAGLDFFFPPEEGASRNTHKVSITPPADYGGTQTFEAYDDEAMAH
jgi:hypothetical protein